MQRLHSSDNHSVTHPSIESVGHLSKSWAHLQGFDPHTELKAYQLKIYDENIFVPCEKKSKGTRPGAIGYMKPDETQQYMLKIEDFNYATTLTTSAIESVALESLCSKLIRFIFGDQYAPDINIIIVKPSDISDALRLPDKQYAVLSKWEPDCSTPNELHSEDELDELKNNERQQFSNDITCIQTIAKLINMSDFKVDNIVKRPDGHLFLVDCAGDLDGSKNITAVFESHWTSSKIVLGNLFIADIALKIIKDYVRADINKIYSIIESYRPLLSGLTIKKITENMLKTRESCSLIINPAPTKSSASLAAAAAAPTSPRPASFYQPSFISSMKDLPRSRHKEALSSSSSPSTFKTSPRK